VKNLIPLLLVLIGAIWLVIVVISEAPAWPLAVYIALAIPSMRRFDAMNDKD
jgi:hypothetical protein